jgi:hypothetical protein
MSRRLGTAWVSVTLACALHAGCGGSDGKSAEVADAGHTEGEKVAEGAPTWHQDIAPLVAEKCSGCHKEKGIAPFSLESYESAKPFAMLMANAVEAGTMPPFLAQDTDECKPKLGWMNDLRLSADQKKLLRRWAEANAPRGDTKSAAEITPPAPSALEREDVIMTVPKEYTIEGKKDLHTCAIVDPKLTKDEYVVGRLITAGNNKILHHVVSYVIEPGQIEDPAGSGTKRTRTRAELEAALLKAKGTGSGGSYDCFGGPALQDVTTTTMLDAWAPGGIANMSPTSSGQPVSKDSLVLLDIHYHPTGAPETDSTTKLSLMLAKEKPAYVSRTLLLGNFEGKVVFGPTGPSGGTGDLLLQPGESAAEFMVPANAKDHIEDMTWTWRLPLGSIRVTGMATHMHYVGRKMRITLEHKAPASSESKEECLIETPRYDFNWQRGYGFDVDYKSNFDSAYKALPEMRDGDTLKFHCEFDNSMDNKFVVKALQDQDLSSPIEVRLGEDTLDEMCLGAVGIMYPNQI